MEKQTRKVIFLDRDGTINIEKSYLHKAEDFEFEVGVIDGLKRLQKLGYEFIVVTNQSGIARGYYTEDDLIKLNEFMVGELEDEGVKILECYYCPHHPEKGIREYKKDCNCRKPNSGMLEMGIEKYNIDREKSFMIGDKKSDLEAGKKAGLKSFLVKTGYGINIYEEILDKHPEYAVVENLIEVAELLESI